MKGDVYMNKTEVTVKVLVESLYKEMLPLKKTKASNRAKLINKAQSIIYNEWGIGNQQVWDYVTWYAEELISEEED